MEQSTHVKNWYPVESLLIVADWVQNQTAESSQHKYLCCFVRESQEEKISGQDNIVRIIMNRSAVMTHEVNTDQVRNSHPSDVHCINSYLRL